MCDALALLPLSSPLLVPSPLIAHALPPPRFFASGICGPVRDQEKL